MSSSIEHNIAKVSQRIREAEKKYQRRSHSVTLIAVSKTRGVELIREAVSAGIYHVGENYLQEAMSKKNELADLDITWHFIGPIQSNKTRTVAENFQWAHCVDRLKIARRLSEQRPPNFPDLNICIQVNISSENSKSGVHITEVCDLAKEIVQLPHIRLRGLMTIGKANCSEYQQREAFKQMKELIQKMQQKFNSIDTLSMGMSSDMQAAIAEGSTMVRIGTDIFGPR